MQAARDFGLQRFAKDLVDSIDNLDRALQNVPQDKLAGNPELKNLYDGLKMTDTILMNTVKKHGLERFDPSETSDKFDPNKHEATFMTPQPDKEDNTVFYCQQKGFALNGRILRVCPSSHELCCISITNMEHRLPRSALSKTPRCPSYRPFSLLKRMFFSDSVAVLYKKWLSVSSGMALGRLLHIPLSMHAAGVRSYRKV